MSKVTMGTKFMLFKKIWHLVFFCSYSKSRNNCTPEMFIFYRANSLVHIHWWSTLSSSFSFGAQGCFTNSLLGHKHGPWREVLVALHSLLLYLSVLRDNPGGRPTPALALHCWAFALLLPPWVTSLGDTPAPALAPPFFSPPHTILGKLRWQNPEYLSDVICSDVGKIVFLPFTSMCGKELLWFCLSSQT